MRITGDSASVKSARAIGVDEDGIQIFGDFATVKSTLALGNGDHGIFVNGESAKVSGNVAEANGMPLGIVDPANLGILVTFTTTGPNGTNIARGNAGADCSPTTIC